MEIHPNHNLPFQPTPFIGREAEITELVEILKSNCQLLSIVGIGGVGKTRLSIEAAKHLSDHFSHGVFFVALAPLTNSSDIASTIVTTLGIQLSNDGETHEELIKFLSRRHLLLIMDNFEHLIDGAELISDIIQGCPDVTILVTSRQTLNLRTERVWQMKGMSYPEAADLDANNNYSALDLFIDRATLVQREFSIVEQLPCAIRICHLVEGLPLAIEIAASWLKTFSCQDVVAQLEQGIDFLTTRTRDIPERHRSIRAVFDHSWQLLSDSEKTVFPALSVFRGGFTLEAAQAVHYRTHLI